MRQSRREPMRWECCPTCFVLVWCRGIAISNHQCCKPLQAKRDAELDMVIDAEFSTWDYEVKKFWDDPRTKFMEYLLEKESGT
jgi:hypothetical protein